MHKKIYAVFRKHLLQSCFVGDVCLCEDKIGVYTLQVAGFAVSTDYFVFLPVQRFS